jgi:hypothetical protein
MNFMNYVCNCNVYFRNPLPEVGIREMVTPKLRYAKQVTPKLRFKQSTIVQIGTVFSNSNGDLDVLF